jgi:hypothetical protein
VMTTLMIKSLPWVAVRAAPGRQYRYVAATGGGSPGRAGFSGEGGR